MKITVTLEIDETMLRSYSDQHLATLWHVAQANPAPYHDKQAGEIAEKIGREIVRRWLGRVEPDLWSHQGHSYYHRQLTQFAKYEPGSRDARDPEWHNGAWVAKGDAADAERDGSAL